MLGKCSKIQKNTKVFYLAIIMPLISLPRFSASVIMKYSVHVVNGKLNARLESKYTSEHGQYFVTRVSSVLLRYFVQVIFL